VNRSTHNTDLAACVLRDAEYQKLTREIIEPRFGPPIAAWHEVLGAKQRDILHLALGFLAGARLCAKAVCNTTSLSEAWFKPSSREQNAD
jgi:hypothetical protein